MRVLVVEDDPINRQLLATIVGMRGHEVITAVDGLDGWASYQAQQFDVVVTDWLMPGIDGAELCRRVKAHACGASTYVILLSALSGPDRSQEAGQAGADDHVVKPVSLPDLDDTLAAAEQAVAGRKKRLT